jgi:hypothetical protein
MIYKFIEKEKLLNEKLLNLHRCSSTDSAAIELKCRATKKKHFKKMLVLENTDPYVIII